MLFFAFSSTGVIRRPELAWRIKLKFFKKVRCDPGAMKQRSIIPRCLIVVLFFVVLLAFNFIIKDSYAEGININLGDSSGKAEGGFSSRIIQLIALVTILSVAPSILIMVTSFTRIVVVLSIMRSALGLQQTPPTSALTSLALFLTFFIMAPTFQQMYQEGIAPLMNNRITEEAAWEHVKSPFHKFMLENVREKELSLFTGMAKLSDVSQNEIPLHVLIPAFMISELKRAFEIGFLVFLPFLIIDLLVSSILMAMGMMMLPPVMISLPFKLIFFVLIDGWSMICGSLVKSYGI
ncbi:flagellar biosynthetic protein FliP [Alphaproteobacteria bacterium]